MANRNFNGTQINQSATIVEKAGAAIEDCRNRIMVYDNDGNVILATDGTKPLIGITLIEGGLNDISGKDSGSVEAGDDVDVQIKDIGYVLAGTEIAKGAEITSGANGLAAVADEGDYVVGVALTAVHKDEYCRMQISKYQKSIGTTGGNENG